LILYWFPNYYTDITNHNVANAPLLFKKPSSVMPSHDILTPKLKAVKCELGVRLEYNY
jgi:hypothetical protein